MAVPFPFHTHTHAHTHTHTHSHIRTRSGHTISLSNTRVPFKGIKRKQSYWGLNWSLNSLIFTLGLEIYVSRLTASFWQKQRIYEKIDNSLKPSIWLSSNRSLPKSWLSYLKLFIFSHLKLVRLYRVFIIRLFQHFILYKDISIFLLLIGLSQLFFCLKISVFVLHKAISQSFLQ